MIPPRWLSPARLVVLCCAVTLSAGVVATASAAGVSAPPYVRTVGQAGQADMYPSGLDVDGAGNVYVADTGNDRVAFYPSGSTTPTWVRGTRGATYAQGSFSNPRDIAVGSSRLLVADTDHYVVQVLTLDGTWIKNLSYPFRSPMGVSVGSDGQGNERTLVSDGGSGNVEVFNAADQHVLTIPPKLGSTAGTRDAATDAAGNIYVADYRHDRIQKYSPTGTWLSSWGGTGSPTCKLIPRPYGVDVDDAGRVYVASSNNNRVKVFDGSGNCLQTYGQNGDTNSTLSQLRRVAVGPGASPLVYAADLWGIKVLVYNAAGTVNSRLGGRPYPAAGGFNEVRAVAVSGQYVYAVDTINQRAQRFDLDGSSPIDWGQKGVSSGSFNWPQAIAVNPVTGNVWVGDTRNNRLQEYAADGSGPLRVIGSTQGKNPGQFYWPMGITFDPAGNMYVADTYNHRIQSFAPDLSFRWTYGTVGTGITNLRRPDGLAYDALNQRLVVADTKNSRLVALNPTSGARLSTFSIPKGSAAGALKEPYGVAVTPDGSLWVADSGNNRIQKFAGDGAFTGESLGGTGPGSTASTFNLPTDIALGPDGLLYVADTNNNRIQVFTP